MDRILEHVVAAVDVARLLALGELGAVAGRREERADARRRPRGCARRGCPAAPVRARSRRRGRARRRRSESAWRGNEQMILRTRLALSSAASPVSPLPALLLTMVRSRAPCAISAVDQLDRHAGRAEAADHHGRAVVDAGDGRLDVGTILSIMACVREDGILARRARARVGRMTAGEQTAASRASPRFRRFLWTRLLGTAANQMLLVALGVADVRPHRQRVGPRPGRPACSSCPRCCSRIPAGQLVDRVDRRARARGQPRVQAVGGARARVGQPRRLGRPRPDLRRSASRSASRARCRCRRSRRSFPRWCRRRSCRARSR